METTTPQGKTARVLATFQVPVAITFGRAIYEVSAAVVAWPLMAERERLSEGNDADWLEFSAREFRLAQMHGPIRLTDETPSLRFSVSVGNIVARQLLGESQ